MSAFENNSESGADENLKFHQVDSKWFRKEQEADSYLHGSFPEGCEIEGSSMVLDKTYPAESRLDVVSVFDVACYVMSKVKQCTTMKLQKLLYYCQAWYLVWNEKPLFRENIEAWANGPVIRELYNFHKGLFNFTEQMMTIGNPNRLSDEQKEDIDSVLNAYACRSSQWLIDQTHSEQPWREARKGLSPNERGHVVISHAAMAEYYSSLYGQEQGEE